MTGGLAYPALMRTQLVFHQIRLLCSRVLIRPLVLQAFNESDLSVSKSLATLPEG